MFKKASDYKNDKLSIITFGKPGSGKTSLTKTLSGNVLVIDAEKGLQSINESDVSTLPLWEDLKGNYLPRGRRFKKFQWFIDKYIAGEIPEKFDWIVIDSITELAQNLIEGLLEEDKQRVASGEKENKFWIWGQYNELMTKCLKDLRDLPHTNVLGLALVDESKNEDGSKDVSMDINGKVSQRLPALFDEVYYLHLKDDSQRVLITESFKNIVCKSRSGKLEKFEEANIQKIADKIKGNTPKKA